MFEFIVSVMGRAGYVGTFLLMLGENVFPPIPSEVIMPLAGFLAARGTLVLWLVIAAGTLGSVAGALFWYWIGREVGEDRLRRFAERHGRWLTIEGRHVDQASDWFRRHGGAAVFFGRLIPGVRTFISVPAGVARMPLAPFLGYTLAGSLPFTAVLAGLGYVLESQYERVGAWLDPISWVVIGAIAGAYVWRLVRR